MILPEDYINRPVRSLQTMLRVLSTIFPALLNVNPDGIYGESTKNAVSAFQRFAHLPATGIAETETWNAHVYLVQAMLQALGQCYANSDPPAVTGVLDASTQRAVRSLQAPFGHEQTGVIDHRFWAYLTRLYTLSAGDGTQSASSGAAPAVNYLL